MVVVLRYLDVVLGRLFSSLYLYFVAWSKIRYMPCLLQNITIIKTSNIQWRPPNMRVPHPFLAAVVTGGGKINPPTSIFTYYPMVVVLGA